VRELADAQSQGTDDWDFRCECGTPECHEVVSLTVDEYELLRASRSPILAEGHEPSRIRVAREVSRGLRDDAAALREQAHLQAERARRNLAIAPRWLDRVCGSCGYGISVKRLPDRCPMCSASNWRPR
jgi:rubrerythrin